METEQLQEVNEEMPEEEVIDQMAELENKADNFKLFISDKLLEVKPLFANGKS